MAVDETYTRSIRFDAIEVTDDKEGVIEGYASVWNAQYEVRDWAGHYMEAFARGAFVKTLSERGPARVRLLYDHGFDTVVGGLPIGTWEDIHEDDHGLYVRGKLLDSWHVAPVRAALEVNAIDGLSIRFRPIVEERDESSDLPLVTHKEVKLLEAGPVVWPASSATEVALRSDAVLNLFRAMMHGELVDLSASRSTVDEPHPNKDEAVQQSLVTRSERRKRAAEIRGVTRNDPTGTAA